MLMSKSKQDGRGRDEVRLTRILRENNHIFPLVSRWSLELLYLMRYPGSDVLLLIEF